MKVINIGKFFAGDKDLVQSLLFDARATNVYSSSDNLEEKIEGKK